MKYSIITVSFNSEKTIERTMKSVLAQEVKDYEYIIVDGASKDGTMDIVKHYEPLFDGRLRWISEKDKGIYNAMNKGVQMAKGDIIGIVNSDDWLQPDTLSILDKAKEVNGVDVTAPVLLTGWMDFHYADGSKQTMIKKQEDCSATAKCASMIVNHPATWVSKTAYESVGLFDENIKISADVDLMLRMYESGANIIFVDNVLTNMSDGGASNHFSMQKYYDRKYVVAKHIPSKVRVFMLLTKWWIKSIAKIVLPESLLKKQRG